jgi:hypothetical protein
MLGVDLSKKVQGTTELYAGNGEKERAGEVESEELRVERGSCKGRSCELSVER